jgi:hypothetical protein
VRVEEAAAIALAGGEPAREFVLGLLGEVAALRERVDEHERLLKRDSTNSSLAPSRDPPLTRQQRRALARERAKASLRKPGAQPGHEGKAREMAAPESVDERFEHLPERCDAGIASTAVMSASAIRWSIRSGSCRRSRRWCSSTGCGGWAARAAARARSPSCPTA